VIGRYVIISKLVPSCFGLKIEYIFCAGNMHTDTCQCSVLSSLAIMIFTTVGLQHINNVQQKPKSLSTRRHHCILHVGWSANSKENFHWGFRHPNLPFPFQWRDCGPCLSQWSSTACRKKCCKFYMVQTNIWNKMWWSVHMSLFQIPSGMFQP